MRAGALGVADLGAVDLPSRESELLVDEPARVGLVEVERFRGLGRLLDDGCRRSWRRKDCGRLEFREFLREPGLLLSCLRGERLPDRTLLRFFVGALLGGHPTFGGGCSRRTRGFGGRLLNRDLVAQTFELRGQSGGLGLWIRWRHKRAGLETRGP